MFSSYGDGTDANLLFDRFKNDLGLLIDIYIKLISCESHIDSGGQYLIQFIQKDHLFIDKFIEYTLIDKATRRHEDQNRLSAIWDCENYIQLADHIFISYYNAEIIYPWEASKYIANLFKIRKNTETRIIRRDEWLSHFINVNFNNSEFMKTIFASIADAEFSSERVRKHLLHFIQLNADPVIFGEIQIEPRSFGGWGSMVPYMEARISFLESLLPALTGLAYLKHKQIIQRRIEGWRRNIEREQIDEILQNR